MMISVLLYIVAKLSVKLQKFEKNFSSPLFFHPYTAKKWQKRPLGGLSPTSNKSTSSLFHLFSRKKVSKKRRGDKF
jgi:hypothetical protein